MQLQPAVWAVRVWAPRHSGQAHHPQQHGRHLASRQALDRTCHVDALLCLRSQELTVLHTIATRACTAHAGMPRGRDARLWPQSQVSAQLQERQTRKDALDALHHQEDLAQTQRAAAETLHKLEARLVSV